MFNNLFGRKVGTVCIAEVTLLENDKYNKFSLETKVGREDIIIESLKETFENFDDIVKVSFIEKDIFIFRNKIYSRKKAEKNYYIGEQISLIEYNLIKSKQSNGYDKLMNIDDYQTAAVIHPRTGKISPIYVNDQIVAPNAKVKTIKR